ncbi:putative tpr repeat-containing protein [Phaeoacremonium minimum UCRPA7]|uniref:Putative tpr repeat-containing protein n=1 Tax=Phaeoacremonium minimum (strain UCR-PA7) TaxID=1286976 RepID=R8BJD8_PHAM7|nr:putative tpr repeat-containing protein [Phaeoacremonium minimum UCRPA7]EON99394.1 putative tpr repeat-containing protein [Phaeoacremonium minimum UCRPA7]
MAPVPKMPDALLEAGRYVDVLTSDEAKYHIRAFVAAMAHDGGVSAGVGDGNGPLRPDDASLHSHTAAVALAAFNAFLQTNVTGPVLSDVQSVEDIFSAAATSRFEESAPKSALMQLRKRCFASLDVDGVSVYPYIPNIELFCLAKWAASSISEESWQIQLEKDGETLRVGLHWMRLRVHVWHYKLLTQPTLGPGSLFNRSAQWSDVPTLQEMVEKSLDEVETKLFKSASGAEGTKQDKVEFLVEKANICIMLGFDTKAKEALSQAAEANTFQYALSGALGKRTRYQEKSTSQLIVLAKSATGDAVTQGNVHKDLEITPDALPLNDDTLLEKIDYQDAEGKNGETAGTGVNLPAALKDLPPDDQPQLSPLDQIILLTEATLKDAFSPVDTLTSEEILPYAARVLSDKSTNWQIYTQALLVRSRIEVHRSRTVERGVLQMQAVVDQVLVDAANDGRDSQLEDTDEAPQSATAVPKIEVSGPGGAALAPNAKPTSFLRATTSSDSAPPQTRLRYLHVLSSPPRWHLESELAYAWAGVGSLVSALEIFKRLRMWAEVALCLASSAATDDEGGRGSGGEAKARAVLRWRLFQRISSTSDDASSQNDNDSDLESQAVDISQLKADDYTGGERSPAPPNAPRLFCILGDIEANADHYERAWVLSGFRFARAQKSLGEHYLQQRNWQKAREAYKKAVAVNRLSPEMWSRLGDISLRLGEFSEAAEAFGRAIASAGDVIGGEDARTWSNLGSSLYSLYCEAIDELKNKKDAGDAGSETLTKDADVEDDTGATTKDENTSLKRDPATLLSQSLNAYKRGATIAHDNWRIWDNVLTLATRVRPIAVIEIIQALRHIVRVRQSEDALDDEILRLLLNEVVLSQSKTGDESNGIYEPPRGSQERAVNDLLEQQVVPLITTRSELWELLSRLRVWRRDYAGAVEASEKAWRAAVGGASTGSLGSTLAATTNDASRNWLENQDAWEVVVKRTDELVSVLENWGPEADGIGAKWKSKARSAIRSVMGKGKESWEGTPEWNSLKDLLEGLR